MESILSKTIIEETNSGEESDSKCVTDGTSVYSTSGALMATIVYHCAHCLYISQTVAEVNQHYHSFHFAANNAVSYESERQNCAEISRKKPNKKSRKMCRNNETALNARKRRKEYSPKKNSRHESLSPSKQLPLRCYYSSCDKHFSSNYFLKMHIKSHKTRKTNSMPKKSSEIANTSSVYDSYNDYSDNNNSSLTLAESECNTETDRQANNFQNNQTVDNDHEFILPQDIIEVQLNNYEETDVIDSLSAIRDDCVKVEPSNSDCDRLQSHYLNATENASLYLQDIDSFGLTKPKSKNSMLCGECGQCFRKDYLPVHMRVHTGERPFKCDFPDCDKTFSQISSRNVHYRTHVADKPFKCDAADNCGREFYKRCDYLKHIRSHAVYRKPKSERQRIYKCRYPGCGKSFGLVCVLQRHEVIHSGFKQFKCDIDGCNYESFWKENLREHYKRRHQQVFIA